MWIGQGGDSIRCEDNLKSIFNGCLLYFGAIFVQQWGIKKIASQKVQRKPSYPDTDRYEPFW